MAEINVVPYIDVTLVLLIIFMITAPLITQGVKIELPQAPSEVMPESKDEPVMVSVNAAGEMMTHRQMTHIVRSDDTAVTQAYASLLYSAAYAFAAALITGGIILTAWLRYGAQDNGGDYALAWLLLWGLSILAALIVNRSQGLFYSSSGIAHHEIDSRERIAMYAMDKHIELIEKRWHLDKK